MNDTGTLTALDERAALAFLTSGAVHAHSRTTPELIETHMSWVVLDEHSALKLRKPVCVPPFYDCRSLAARERESRAELLDNRPLAPGVYRGLMALRSDGRHFALVAEEALGPDDGDGWHTVDWLVHMRRLPRALMLDRAIGDSSVQRAQIEALALALSRFWQHATPAPVTPAGHRARFADELARHRAVLLQPRFALAEARPVLAALERAQAGLGDALERRVRLGRVVDGHGDLRPEHVCLSEPPVVIDRMTFHAGLRQVDPFEELAGLALECERMGAGWIGPLLIERCIERLDDDPGAELLKFYAADRAVLRARLAAAHLLDPAPREPARWLARAARHLAQALKALDALDVAWAAPDRR